MAEAGALIEAVLPPAAGPGDRVGVAALSGPVEPERLERGLAALRALGFEPVVADNLASRHGLFAGADGERLAAFHRLAADRDLAAILFARGGHGVLRLLPGIDWDLLARRPRAYVGYSDLTPLLLEMVRRLGRVAFHGPMVAVDLARGLLPDEEESLLGALAGRYPAEVPLGTSLRLGEASGPLLGGCLSLLTATQGTPFAPDLSGAILFWEEINEPPYRVDRMLTHLRLSGSLTAIAGMIVGHLQGAGEPGPSRDGYETDGRGWPALVEQSVDGFDWPLAWDLPCGHRPPNWTLPLGLPAHLSSGRSSLTLG
ncbi:MAG: LD-carboxypeptidase [Acidobacteriota bacterium]|nr:LD-carboxypeptidase [Acidobacteriota bacterium]